MTPQLQKVGELPGSPRARSQTSKIVRVVLPAYNEALNIGKLIEQIDESMGEDGVSYQIIVVDDGSEDNTREVVESYSKNLPVLLEKHKKNSGLGSTIRDGLQIAARECGPRDVIVVMDADNTHSPGLIRRMYRGIREGNDVVIASRFQPGAHVRGVPFIRRLLSSAASIVFRVFFPIRGVRDYTCGYRAYRGDILKQAFEKYGTEFISQDGFECMVDILLKLRKMDVVFGEVPLILRYDFKEGASKMRVLKTIFQSLTLVLKRRLGR